MEEPAWCFDIDMCYSIILLCFLNLFITSQVFIRERKNIFNVWFLPIRNTIHYYWPAHFIFPVYMKIYLLSKFAPTSTTLTSVNQYSTSHSTKFDFLKSYGVCWYIWPYHLGQSFCMQQIMSCIFSMYVCKCFST